MQCAELATYLGNQYLNLADTYFVELIETDVEQFLKTATTKRVLIFPPFDSYHRLLVHKVIESSSTLHSFSIGEGDKRRTVVCLHLALVSGEERGELMSSPIPEFSSKSKGRGRGRNLDRNSPSPVGRREDSKSSSPGGSPHVDSDVKVRSRPAGRGKTKRPEIQRYVPRGRRQQGEDVDSQRQNDSTDNKSVSPRPREGRERIISSHKPNIRSTGSETRRDETPESWDRLADDDFMDPNDDKPAVEVHLESTASPASKKSKTDPKSSDICNESDAPQSPKSVLSRTDQTDISPPALSSELAHLDSSSIPQNSIASNDSVNTTEQIHTSKEPNLFPNSEDLNLRVDEENGNNAQSEEKTTSNPSSDITNDEVMKEANSDLNELVNEADKLPIIDDNSMETSHNIEASEDLSTEFHKDIQVTESISEATAKDMNPIISNPSETDEDVKIPNITTNDSSDMVRSESEYTTDNTPISATVNPANSDEPTSGISEPCQNDISLAEKPNEAVDIDKKSKKKKEKSKKKGDKKSKTDNDDEGVDKPKKKKSKSEKIKGISKNPPTNDVDMKEVNEDTVKTDTEDNVDECLVTGNEKIKVQQDYKNEDDEGKMKTDTAVDDDDEDDWDKMFDDNGDCLEPSLIDELTAHVGQVEIDKPKIDYLAYQPKDADLSSSAYHHLIEIYDFPSEFKTQDLLMFFQSYIKKGFDIKWVDDTHAIGVFTSAVAAQDAAKMMHPLFKVRPIEIASKQSKLKVKRTSEFLMPYKERPKTTAMAARRLVSGALGLTSKISKEKSDQERSQLKEAKEKRKNERKLKQDIWDGSVSKCAMDNS